MNRLAGKLNEMQNPKLIGISVGEVVTASPLTISIAGGNVRLEEGNGLVVCEGLKNTEYEVTYKFSDQSTDTGTLEINPNIQVGDKILVVPMADEQTWIAIDRISEE